MVAANQFPADLVGMTDFGSGGRPIYETVLGQALNGQRIDPQAVAQAAAGGSGAGGGGGIGALTSMAGGGGYSASVSSGAETGDQTQGDIDQSQRFRMDSGFSAFNKGPSTGAMIGIAAAAVVGLLGLVALLTRRR